ncbi:hypothetical protein [Profundibacter sp.]|uniref:hypothetical protein n=1 Tax=Profundibacter sp. TaxID=3101071 RepID=UPI003D1124A9
MFLDPILDIFRGKTITIPPLDGAYRANTALDDAPLFSDLAQADNLAILDGRVIASSGNQLCTFDGKGTPETLAEYAAPVTAVAVSPSGELAVALDDGALMIGDNPCEKPDELICITALAFGPDGTLWLANGSATNLASDWVVDLMQKNASGSVWKQEAGKFVRVAGELAYPYGLLPDDKGNVVVSESWRHRLIRLDGASGKITPVITHIPGYPARLSPRADGGALMSVFAPRNRLIELVLLEKHYRTDMMAQVPRRFWIAPALATGASFMEPLQIGGMKIMGVHKPWSPSRSWGMVVRLNADMHPVDSFHSRANGKRHGTCAAIEYENRIIVASKGGNAILKLNVT